MAAAGRIKVASYNMRKAIGLDRRRDPGRVLDVLAEIDADIVALQEADRRFGTRASAIPLPMLAEHSPYAAVELGGREHSIGWHGNAMLIRRDRVDVVSSDPLHLPTLEPRGAIAAVLSVGGVRLRIVGMHLDLSGLRRHRQALAVTAHLGQCDPLPTVLMGDLNAWRDGAASLRELSAGHRMLPTGKSFHARRPMAPLDRIFVSPDLSLVECGVHHSAAASVASDHLPIWAVLDLAASA